MEYEKKPSLWPLALLGTLFFAWLKIKPVDSQTKEVNSDQNAGQAPHESAPVLTSKLNVPKAVSHQEEPYKKRRKIPDWLKFLVNVLTLSALVWYACEARKQRIAMDTSNGFTKQALELNKKLIKGTYAAVVSADIGFDGNDSTVNVGFVNHGKAITSTVANFEIVQESLPDETGLRFHKSYITNDSVVREAEGPNHYYVIDGFTKEDLELYKASREGIKVSGTFRYDDGFGETVTRNFCLITAAFGRFPCDGLVRYMHSLPHS